MSDGTAGRRRDRWARRVVMAAAVLGVVATGLAVWRALLTQERCDGTRGTLTPAGNGGEPAIADTRPAVLAHTASAPLLVGGRLRVLAVGSRIWSEAITGNAGHSGAYWSCDGSATVTGVVADDTLPATVVVSWSDGQLDAIDAATGRIRWHRAIVPDGTAPSGPLAPTYPSGGLFLLRTLRTDVVMISRPSLLQGFAMADGHPLWTRGLGGTNCGGPGFSTAFTLAGQPVGQTYVFHDECANSEIAVDPATGRDIRDLNGRDHMGEGWYVVPDACQWPDVGCAVFSWVFGDGSYLGADVAPAFTSRTTGTYPYPLALPYPGDERGWATDQAAGPDVAIATDVAVLHLPLRPGIQGWAQDRYARLWSDTQVNGYLYGDGTRAYVVTEKAFAAVDPGSGALSTLVRLDGLTAVAGVVTDGALGVVVGPDGASAIVSLG